MQESAPADTKFARRALCAALTVVLAIVPITVGMLAVSFLVLGFSEWQRAAEESFTVGSVILLFAAFLFVFAMDLLGRRTFWQWIWPSMIIGPHLAFFSAVFVRATEGTSYAFEIAEQMGFQRFPEAFVYLLAFAIMVPASVVSGFVLRWVWGLLSKQMGLVPQS